MDTKTEDIEKFFAKVKIHPNKCWEWIGTINNKGYGHFYPNGKTIMAHRFSYELCFGSIENQIDHLCRNRRCVNPNHLEDVTSAENIRRGTSYNRNKTHCPKGHPYNEANTHIDKDRKKHCRVCGRIYAKKKYDRLKMSQEKGD